MKKNDIKPGNIFEFDSSNKFTVGKFTIIFVTEDNTVYWYALGTDEIYTRNIKSMTTIKADLIGKNFLIYTIPEQAKIRLFDKILGI